MTKKKNAKSTAKATRREGRGSPPPVASSSSPSSSSPSSSSSSSSSSSTSPSTSTLTRPQNPMPAFVHQALVEQNLLEAYRRRPPFQQNDWLGWIARAKQEPTKARRLASMLTELRQGHGYMGMVWKPS